MCKNRARARQLYEYVVQRFPQSREAQLSKSALRAFQSQSASRQQSVDTSLADGKTAAAELPRQNFASRDIRGLIKVVKAKEGREEVSAPFVEDVAGQLKNIPLALLHMFRDHGLKICVTPTAIDYDPHLATVQPRGYENGKTFRNVPAFYRHPDLVIAEYCFSGDNDSSLARTDDPLGAMWHELGHAVSNVLGNLSQDPEFLRNYKKDLELMDPSVKERLSYYTQSGPGGPSETFAEMFAAIYGSRGTFWRQSQAELVYDSFREVVSFMKYKISQLR